MQDGRHPLGVIAPPTRRPHLRSKMAAARRLYYTPSLPSAFGSFAKLRSAVPSPSRQSVYDWLLQQDAFTKHRPLRRHFPRNPYNVTNMMDVWECDLMDMRSLSKYNDRYKYLLSVIDVFSKFLHIVPLRAKTGIPFDAREVFKARAQTSDLGTDG